MEPSNIPPTDNLPKQTSENQSPAFTTKTVEQPFLDNAVREQIMPQSSGGGSSRSPRFGVEAGQGDSEAGGWKNFYRENKFYLWGILAGLLVIAGLAFFAFRKQPAPVLKEANVSVSIDAPETVASGSEVIYKIKVENQDTSKLVNLHLELAYPDGVSYISSSPKPENLSGSLFSVPDLITGQNAVVIIKAKAAGGVNDQKQLSLKLRYHYSNFNSEFVKNAQNAIRLVASDINMEITGPSNTNNAQLVIYTLNYQNNSKADVKNIRVKMDYPDGFNFVSAAPLPDLDNNIWSLPILPTTATGTIEVHGTYKAAGAGENKTISAELLVLGQDGQYQPQGGVSFTTAIANLPLAVSQELQDNSAGIVNPGDLLTFNIDYQNTANTAASAVIAVATINSNAADLSTLRAEGGQISGNTILWNASSIPNMQSLAPNEAGSLSFSVQLKNPATRDSSKNLTVVSSIKIKSNEYETFFPGNDLKIKISSLAGIAASLKYLSGALPPEVGKATIYQASFLLNNSTNDFSDGSLAVFIPLGAGGFVDKSVNSSEAGKVDYDEATNKLTWNFGSLPAHTGQFSAARILQFSVRIIPSASQVNQSPILVKSIALSAKDDFTGQDINLTADDITTSDLAGQQGYGNGQVVP